MKLAVLILSVLMLAVTSINSGPIDRVVMVSDSDAIKVVDSNVNLQMVRNGYTWHYKHFDKTAECAQAELYARGKNLCLWIDKNPVEPYHFRKLSKKN